MGDSDLSVVDNGTSIFDPVLAEIDYCWFSAPGDTIIDPFAGGSVRGVVASRLDRVYTGIDLRIEQIEENIKQGRALCESQPTWICGDSTNIVELVDGETFDHIFTCPPYGSLEVYSDDPRDISNMAADDFSEQYSLILNRTCSLLRDDRFATIVVGNYRDKKGYLIDLAGITVKAMEDAGLYYYNDAILVTQTASLSIRAGRPFKTSRKLGRTHQYVLNFVKGDPKKATERLGDVVIPDTDDVTE